jgi:uncharacterized Fe-S cluster-containing MiaB family protein
MNPRKIVNMFMQRSVLKGILLVVIVVFITTGCNASKKNGCGCPNKKGMVGY